MSAKYAQLIEKVNQAVRDKGDSELMVVLDRIVEHKTEEEQSAALAVVVRIINENKKKTKPVDSTTSSETN